MRSKRKSLFHRWKESAMRMRHVINIHVHANNRTFQSFSNAHCVSIMCFFKSQSCIFYVFSARTDLDLNLTIVTSLTLLLLSNRSCSADIRKFNRTVNRIHSFTNFTPAQRLMVAWSHESNVKPISSLRKEW